MKRAKIIFALSAALLLAGCGVPATQGGQPAQGNNPQKAGNVLGDILTGVVGGTVGNVITSVIGGQKVTAKHLIGSWHYSQPGCAFMSDQLLAKAGGEVAAAKVKQKALPYYQKIGITPQNTYITFKQDGTYQASFDGKPMSGQWTLDESTCRVTLQGLLLSINCYAKRNVDGIALLFEASKLLTLMQTIAALSGNQTIQTIGDLSKSYDGMRLGFDFK